MCQPYIESAATLSDICINMTPPDNTVHSSLWFRRQRRISLQLHRGRREGSKRQGGGGSHGGWAVLGRKRVTKGRRREDGGRWEGRRGGISSRYCAKGGMQGVILRTHTLSSARYPEFLLSPATDKKSYLFSSPSSTSKPHPSRARRKAERGKNTAGVYICDRRSYRLRSP